MDVPELAVLAGFAEIVGKAVISHVRLPIQIQERELFLALAGESTACLYRTDWEDRIDIHVEVPAIPYRDLMGKTKPESSSVIRRRVSAARRIESERLARTKIYCNAQMSNRHIKKYSEIDDGASHVLEAAIDKLGLSTGPTTAYWKSPVPSSTSKGYPTSRWTTFQGPSSTGVWIVGNGWSNPWLQRRETSLKPYFY